jgi:hypothetical protein
VLAPVILGEGNLDEKRETSTDSVFIPSATIAGKFGVAIDHFATALDGGRGAFFRKLPHVSRWRAAPLC